MTEKVHSILVLNNLISHKEFNALLASTILYYLRFSEKEVAVNFVRENEIVSNLGHLVMPHQ
jgi:hypothetical protein